MRPCPNCQKSEAADARYCTQCGALLVPSGWARALSPRDQDGRWVLGRQAGVDVELESPVVSGRHLLLEREDGRWFATDLGSKNGTTLDGRPLTAPRTPLAREALVRLGTLTLTGAMIATARRRRIATPAAELVVGSAPDSDLVLEDPTVSPRHAALRRTAEGWRVRDLGSHRGTRVNGRRIVGEALLRPGDRLELGHLRLESDAGGLRGVDLSRELRLDVDGLCDSTDAGEPLLQDIRFSVQPGELVLVLGPTGAGKSTLLRALAGARPPKAGAIRVNGVSIYENLDYSAGIIGLVPQEDVLPRGLSAREVLRFAARMHLPAEQAEARAAALLRQLDLEECADLCVTDATGGLSGGQRKRLNIAVELVPSPALLLLDEPTSGLDARAAMRLMHLLRGLADQGRPVLLSVHQPRIEAFELADAALVLARGHLAWFGPPEALEAQARGRLGSAAHARANPADLALDALDAVRSDADAARLAAEFRDSRIFAQWVSGRMSPAGAAAAPGAAPSVPALGVLTRRSFAELAADGRELAVLLVQAPAVGLLVAALFGRLRFLWVPMPGAVPRDELSPALFLLCTACLWLSCGNAARALVRDRPLYLRERRQGVGPLAWLGSKVTVYGLLAVAQAAVLALFSTGLGMPFGAQVFAVLALSGWVGAALGLALSSVARSEQAAVMLVPLLVLPQIALGGLMLPANEMPDLLRELSDVGIPLRALFESLALLQLPERLGGVLRLESLGMAHRAAPLPAWNARLWIPALWTLLPLLLAERRLRAEPPR